MAGNSFGKLFKLTTFGESHGAAIGGILDGCPAGVKIDTALIQRELNRRKPGQSKITTSRKESDIVQLLSGVVDGVSLGTPIAFSINNEDAKSKDYSSFKDTFRPSHADYTYQEKYGIRDHRGGGRSSARETASRVVAGSIAKQWLSTLNIELIAYVESVGEIRTDIDYRAVTPAMVEGSMVRCPDEKVAAQMVKLIEAQKKKGDTIGGTIKGVIRGLPTGLGEPVFDKFHAVLGMAMLSINAVKGFEYGSGFEGVKHPGSQQNDHFEVLAGEVRTKTNNSGGIQGGITNGEDVYFSVAFKSVATIMMAQDTVNTEKEEVEISGVGRHDPCVLPRAVPIVEAMAALVSADFLLQQRVTQL